MGEEKEETNWNKEQYQLLAKVIYCTEFANWTRARQADLYNFWGSKKGFLKRSTYSLKGRHRIQEYKDIQAEFFKEREQSDISMNDYVAEALKEFYQWEKENEVKSSSKLPSTKSIKQSQSSISTQQVQQSPTTALSKIDRVVARSISSLSSSTTQPIAESTKSSTPVPSSQGSHKPFIYEELEMCRAINEIYQSEPIIRRLTTYNSIMSIMAGKDYSITSDDYRAMLKYLNRIGSRSIRELTEQQLSSEGKSTSRTIPIVHNIMEIAADRTSQTLVESRQLRPGGSSKGFIMIRKDPYESESENGLTGDDKCKFVSDKDDRAKGIIGMKRSASEEGAQTSKKAKNQTISQSIKSSAVDQDRFDFDRLKSLSHDELSDKAVITVIEFALSCIYDDHRIKFLNTIPMFHLKNRSAADRSLIDVKCHDSCILTGSTPLDPSQECIHRSWLKRIDMQPIAQYTNNPIMYHDYIVLENQAVAEAIVDSWRTTANQPLDEWVAGVTQYDLTADFGNVYALVIEEVLSPSSEATNHYLIRCVVGEVMDPTDPTTRTKAILVRWGDRLVILVKTDLISKCHGTRKIKWISLTDLSTFLGIHLRILSTNWHDAKLFQYIRDGKIICPIDPKVTTELEQSLIDHYASRSIEYDENLSKIARSAAGGGIAIVPCGYDYHAIEAVIYLIKAIFRQNKSNRLLIMSRDHEEIKELMKILMLMPTEEIKSDGGLALIFGEHPGDTESAPKEYYLRSLVNESKDETEGSWSVRSLREAVKKYMDRLTIAFTTPDELFRASIGSTGFTHVVLLRARHLTKSEILATLGASTQCLMLADKVKETIFVPTIHQPVAPPANEPFYEWLKDRPGCEPPGYLDMQSSAHPLVMELAKECYPFKVKSNQSDYDGELEDMKLRIGQTVSIGHSRVVLVRYKLDDQEAYGGDLTNYISNNVDPTQNIIEANLIRMVIDSICKRIGENSSLKINIGSTYLYQLQVLKSAVSELLKQLDKDIRTTNKTLDIRYCDDLILPADIAILSLSRLSHDQNAPNQELPIDLTPIIRSTSEYVFVVLCEDAIESGSIWEKIVGNEDYTFLEINRTITESTLPYFTKFNTLPQH